MLKLMRKELDNTIKVQMPLAALVDALSLLDGISKVEYPSESSQKKRYEDWWDNFAKRPNDSLDGVTVYQIRCFVMHETKMAIHSKNIDILALSISNNFNGIGINTDGQLNNRHYYRLDLYGFCKQVCNSFDDYYETHKDIVDLADIELFVVTDDELEKWKWEQITITDLCTDIEKLHNANMLAKSLGSVEVI